MDEEERPSPSFEQIRAMFERGTLDQQPHNHHGECGNISAEKDEDENLNAAGYGQSVRQYSPQGYLETLAEVTEEPTMILCSLANGSDKGDMTLLSPIRLRRQHAEDATLADSPTSTPIAQSQVTPSHQAWAQLHGLGTPSTLASGSSRFGWAEVIASATRSINASPSSGWLSPIGSTASPKPSPAQMIGMRSNFWLSSPPHFSLPSGVSHHAGLLYARGLQARRRSVEYSALDDESDWVDAALDDPTDVNAAAELSSAHDLSKRAKPWKQRLSSRFASTG
jgi:hypothetical protein